jgi:hypothetical protein
MGFECCVAFSKAGPQIMEGLFGGIKADLPRTTGNMSRCIVLLGHYVDLASTARVAEHRGLGLGLLAHTLRYPPCGKFGVALMWL